MDLEQLIEALKAALEAQNADTLESLGKEAIENYPEEALGYYYLAEAFLLDDNPLFPNAELLLAKAIQLAPDNHSYKIRFAQIKAFQGAYDDASIVYRQVINDDASNLDALLGLASCELYAAQNAEAALEYLESAANAGSVDPELYLMQIEAYSDIEQYDKALQVADDALKSGFTVDLGQAKLTILQLMGNTKEQASLFNKLIESDPENFALRYQYGALLLNQAMYTEAEEQLSKALSIQDDGNPELKDKLGTAYLELHQYQEALECFNYCVEAVPQEPYYTVSRSDAKMGLKDYKGALLDLNTAIKTIGDDPVLTTPLQYKRGLIFIEASALDKAQALYTKMQQKKESERYGDFGMGVLLHRQGNLQKAYSMLKKAYKANVQDAKKYIEKHFGAFLEDKKISILSQQAAAIDSNMQSSVVQQLSGKLWAFKDLNSKKMEKVPPAMMQRIKASLEVCSMLITEKGILFMNEGTGETLTYQIRNESNNQLDLEFIVLDGEKRFNVQFKLKNGLLHLSKEKDEWLIYEAQKVDSIPASIKNNIKSTIATDTLDFLGKNAEELVKSIYA